MYLETSDGDRPKYSEILPAERGLSRKSEVIWLIANLSTINSLNNLLNSSLVKKLLYSSSDLKGNLSLSLSTNLM
jgi:hypothetical protein